MIGTPASRSGASEQLACATWRAFSKVLFIFFIFFPPLTQARILKSTEELARAISRAFSTVHSIGTLYGKKYEFCF